MAESIYYSQIDDQSEDIDYEGSIEEETRTMKIDHSRLRKSTSEPPSECRALIDRLKKCSRIQLLEELSKISTWTFGKCELGHWKEVLSIFDAVLEEATDSDPENKWALNCDVKYSNSDKKLLLWILHFTTLLIEHSFSRHTYRSMDKLLALLASSDMSVVLGVLNLLYMFSKRSNFITRMHCDQRLQLISRLHHLAESWGGKENGFGLADCCNSEKPMPPSGTTLHFEFHNNQTDSKESKTKQNMTYIHVEHVDQIRKTPAEIMKGLLALYSIPADKEMVLFTHVRLAYHFSNYRNRLLCVQARLQALSVLVYANALQDSAHTLLYNGLLEELVELIELKLPYLVEIRSAALRTLTSIIHLDRNPHFPKKPGSRLNNIIDVTGASQYHGFLPVLVRYCISCLTSQTDGKLSKYDDKSEVAMIDVEKVELDDDTADPSKYMEYVSDVGVNSQLSSDLKVKFPLPLATALFSFLYHLASYESGGDALVSCGMMESLLQVINWHGIELEHITFVTRAVRVIDLITNIDMQAFYNHGGLQSFINRLDVEVNLCLKEHSFDFRHVAVDNECERAGPSEGLQEEESINFEFQHNSDNFGKSCLPQRAALLKSMLNFLKKALQDSTFSEHIRHLMEGTLPTSLKHIISNAEYYGPSLFLLATDVVTVYVFQEPSLLSTIQDNGLTDVVLQALLVKDVPATREVLASLPNVFSALCLNARGLASFVKCKPFERLFKVLLSPTYLSAMRKRRSSDPMGDAASNLGNAMDELMRHQPSLKVDATVAIIKLLNELCQLGTDPKYICWRPHSKSEVSPNSTQRSTSNTEGSSDDEEEDDEEETSTSSQNAQTDSQESQGHSSEKTPIALTEYILNVTKFIDAILSNNSTDDHCREFVNQGGLVPLLKILGLPNLPVDCPVTNSAQAVASVCKSILNLAHEPKVLDQGLTQLSEVLLKLKPLYSHLDIPGGSKLLHELASAPHLESAFSTESATPLLHAMGAAHGYVLMFVHVCRTGQNEIRTLSLQHWGSEKGITVLKGLAELYTSLVWESTLLLALCSDDVIPSDCDFGREDMEKLNIPLTEKPETNSDTAGNVASAMEALTTNPQPLMDVDESVSPNKPTSQQLKYIKPLLGASSRLGRALAELFGLLVKLCVGSPIRQRRGQNIVATPAFPSPHAQSVATALNSLLANGLNSDKLPPSPVPKFRLTFLICSVGFTSPMLFDEKRYPYHLMLQKFVRLGGQTTFFNTFQWALSAGGIIPPEEGLEHPNLPEGTGEFLDAWLTLLEKMVNPKAILDSPHVITTKSQTAFKSIAFDPLKYLIQIHKLAFEAVMMLWGKKPLPSYGVRMSDSILSILRHILRGEKIIKDRLTKTDDKAGEDAAGSSSTSASSNARTESDVNAENLRQLLDMGFTREHAMEALMNCLSVEQATDYLLSHPPPFSVLESSRGTDIDFSEDDQVIQAIAMSLGELGPSAEAKKKEEIQEDVQPLSETLIDNFTHGALQICLDLIKVIPESVFKVCDLLVTIMKRNGREFRDQLLDDFCKLFTYIYNSYEPAISSSNIEASEFDLFTESENALRLAYYSHLFTLFFEVPSYFDMKGPCGLAVYRAGLVPHFINLIQLAEKNLSKSKKKVTVPKWLTPILLLLDSLGKVAVSTQRKRYMHLVTKRIWKWYDVVSGKWTPYSPTNNKIINEAYWNGEQTARITCGRRRYTISFSNMQQINEESNNNRPICMTPINMTFDKGNDLKLEAYDTMENDQVTLTEKEEKRCIPIPGYSATQSEEIVRSCVKLMKLEIDKDTLHAIMRLCLRLTQNFENAKIFVKEGGISCLIQLKESMTFHGFRPLATLLIRHTFEGPSTLAYAMEKVMRGRALPSTPPPYKELMFMLRSLGSAVSRDPNTFLDVAKATLRVDINSFRRNDEVDTRMPMKTEPSNRTQAPPMKEQESMEVVYELLNSLVQPIEVNQTEEENFEANKQQPSTTTNSRESMCQRASYLLSSDTNSTDILNVDGQEEVRPKITRSSSDSATENKSNNEVGHRPILAKHSVLKILADAVVSYAGVAKLITEYTYKSNVDTVPEDCTCLAFLFDNILPMVEGISDRDCSMMSRNLISGIASCNHSPEAQATLVTEVKAALIRALLMPESTEKHTRLQHITAIILNMIEQCPPVQQVRIFKAQTFNANVNNIARLMLRKGIFNDLARVPHCLDMSSPNFPITINSALKPMECLSKIVNQPVTGNITGNITKKRQRHNLDDNRTTNSGMTSTEATNAQGEEAVEDTENTEHDLSAVASSLEGNPITSSVHDINDLEEIMDQLLERGPNATMEIDDDTNLGYDHERDATEELMSTDSGESEDEVDEDENEEEENEIDDGEGEENEDDNDDEEEEEDIDEGDDDDDNNYIDFENAVAPNVDRDEDIVMIQYPDDSENDSFPFVRWNNNGLSIRLFEDAGNSTDQSVPPSHPLLVSRHNTESNSGTVTRTQRTNRTRRYQYLPLNTRNANPPVILQRYLVRRLLGPTAQNLHLGSNQMLNSPGLRDSARVVVMDNFGIFPSVEEQIDFVDQSGYLFGPSMMATSNHIPVALHWWKEESRYIDGESMHDVVTYICNKLVPTLLKHRNAELNERKRKNEQDESKQSKSKGKSNEETGSKLEENQESGVASNSVTNSENMDSSVPEDVQQYAGNESDLTESEEDIDGVPLDDSPYNTPTNAISGNRSRSQNEQQPIRVVNLLDLHQENRPTSENFIFPNMPSPPRMELMNDGPDEVQSEPVEEHDDEHDEEQDENDENRHSGPGNSWLSTMCQRPYSLLATPSLLRPLFQYTSSNSSDSQVVNQSENSSGPEPSSTSQEQSNSPSPQIQMTAPSTASEQASTSQDQALSDNARNSELNEDVPEGVDPSFLDALPPEMRREVLEQHRMLRLQQRISMSGTSDQAVAGGSNEVSPEFLAALPLSLQEEVLTQQRLEQQRQAAARANPDEPVDAGAFFETLQPSLRTMILSDMEDSQMSVLPPDLAAEAQTLRRDWEARNRQMVQERFFQSNLTTIIRHSTRGRLGSRFSPQVINHRHEWNWSQRDIVPQSSTTPNIRIRGRQLLDHESLSCLLVLLFVDDPKLNTGRLHRVIRNLCYHVPTRDWVVKALLSIIDRSVHVKPDESLNKPKRLPRPGPLTSKLITDSKNMGNGANWLNIRMEAALGCHANVFIVNKVSGKRTNVTTVTIHPQAAPIVCRNALDLFTSLSRSFPTFLLPLKPKDKSKLPGPVKFKNENTDFWDMLLKLDAASTKKGKSLAKTHSNLNLNTETENTSLSFEQSAFGQLLVMLSSPVIRSSIHLTDKLLRLLSVISMGMPELSKSSESSRTNKNTSQHFESVLAPEAALNLAVSVLTYKSCSEEGLEEVTTLLLNMSNCTIDMSFMILNLLLKGALRIGEIVRSQIQDMLEELKNVHKVQKRKVQEEQTPSTSKGILNNRFTKEAVVITASSKVKTSCDLQLPSMVPLTSKSSSQIFFLRVLRVIVQIRDAIKKSLEKEERTIHSQLSPLSDQLEDLENLWNTLSQCLLELEHTPDHHAVLVLQPAVEAFFLVHSPQQEANVSSDSSKSTNDSVQENTDSVGAGSSSQSQSNDLTVSSSDTTGRASVPPDQLKFLNFAEKHRTVLNQILRQTTAHLADGPFSVLVDHTRVLDFDIKRRYFRTELERLDQNLRREETAVHVRREHVFEDSFRELYRRTPEEWKNRFYIVFEDEEGQDAGGLLREWYVIISRDIFNPMYALFTVSPGDRVTYMINSASHYNPNHLCYYKFVGRVIAKAIYDNKLLECYFTRSFYKHILGIPVKYTDMESEDYSFYRGLVYLMENNINDLGCDLTFSTEINEFGVTETRDLITNGRNVPVTEENKMEYVRLSCQMKMTGAIRQQLTAFLEGFYDIIPKRLISIFNEQELELLISGLPNVDIEDLKANTEYHKYQATSLQIQWFWRALRSFDQADRAKFLQFVTGTSKVPLQGFGALEGMNGVQKFQIHRDDRSTDRLPSAHTCFNQLDLPVYETYDKLRSYLLKAIHECSEGFGFA